MKILPEEVSGFTAPDKVVPRIGTPHGTMMCASLRPGDWIACGDELFICVLINSAKLARASIRWADGVPQPVTHDYIMASGFAFIGRGKRRWWVPRWAKKWICPYSKP